MKQISSLTLALALLVTAASSAFAAKGKKGKERLPIPPGKQLRQSMTLTPSQRRSLEQVRRETNAESRRLQTQINQLRAELDGLYQDYNLNLERVKAIHQGINAAQAQLLENHLKAQKRVRAILNPQEFAALQDSLRTTATPAAPAHAPAATNR